MANVLSLITIGDIYLLECDSDPTLSATILPNGTSIPVGSLVFVSAGAGQGFIKTAVGDTNFKRIDLSDNDWSLLGNLLTGASATNPNEYLGSNNDFDVVFKRNLVEAMRIQNGGLGNGLIFGVGSNVLGEYLRLNMSATRQISQVIQTYNNFGKTMLTRDISSSIQTTNATPTPIFSFTTSNDTSILMKLLILARASVGGTVGNVSSYSRTITARNVGGVVSIRQTNSDQSYEDDGALNITATISSATINVNAVGIAARTFDWFLSGQLLTTT